MISASQEDRATEGCFFEDQEIEAWGGPNQGTQLIPGSSWQPYQDVTFVTPAFPEYPSGHSGFSYAAATVLEAFTGSDVLYDGVSTGVQDLNGDGDRYGSKRNKTSQYHGCMTQGLGCTGFHTAVRTQRRQRTRICSLNIGISWLLRD